MANLNPKPDIFKRGQIQLSATALNEMRAIDIRQIRGGRGIDSSSFGDRAYIEGIPAKSFDLPELANYITPFIVLSEQVDYLTCTPFYQPNGIYNDNGLAIQTWIPYLYSSTEVPDHPEFYGPSGVYPLVYVAKPYALQQSGWNSVVVMEDGAFVSCVNVDSGFNPTTNMKRALPGIRSVAINGELPTFQAIQYNYVSGDVIYAIKNPTGYVHKDNSGADSIALVWTDINQAARKWWNPPKLKGTLLTTMSHNSTSAMAVSGWKGGSLTVHDWLLGSGQTLSNGTRVTAFFQDWQWWVDSAACE